MQFVGYILHLIDFFRNIDKVKYTNFFNKKS